MIYTPSSVPSPSGIGFDCPGAADAPHASPPLCTHDPICCIAQRCILSHDPPNKWRENQLSADGARAAVLTKPRSAACCALLLARVMRRRRRLRRSSVPLPGSSPTFFWISADSRHVSCRGEGVGASSSCGAESVRGARTRLCSSQRSSWEKREGFFPRPRLLRGEQR